MLIRNGIVAEDVKPQVQVHGLEFMVDRWAAAPEHTSAGCYGWKLFRCLKKVFMQEHTPLDQCIGQGLGCPPGKLVWTPWGWQYPLHLPLVLCGDTAMASFGLETAVASIFYAEFSAAGTWQQHTCYSKLKAEACSSPWWFSCHCWAVAVPDICRTRNWDTRIFFRFLWSEGRTGEVYAWKEAVVSSQALIQKLWMLSTSQNLHSCVLGAYVSCGRTTGYFSFCMTQLKWRGGWSGLLSLFCRWVDMQRSLPVWYLFLKICVSYSVGFTNI